MCTYIASLCCLCIPLSVCLYCSEGSDCCRSDCIASTKPPEEVSTELFARGIAVLGETDPLPVAAVTRVPTSTAAYIPDACIRRQYAYTQIYPQTTSD